MAKRDWKALAERYKKDAENTGITVKDFCKLHGLPLNSARRYIKPLNSISNEAETGDHSVKSDHHVITGQKTGLSDLPPTENQRLMTAESVASDQNELEDSDHHTVRNANMARPGNQNARKNGHYIEFIRTDKDVERYASAENASISDELYLCRTQLSNVMDTISSLEEMLKGEFVDVKDKLNTFDQLRAARASFDGKVGRIESLENSIEKNNKITVEIKRYQSQIKKLDLEAKALSKDSGSTQIAISQVYDDILALNDNGMMAGGYEESLNITIDAEYEVISEEEAGAAI